MSQFLNNLSIRARMLLSVSLFLLTLLYSMYGAYQSIGANIEFAMMEKKGNLYQRPLAELLHDAGRLRFALAEARADVNSAADIRDFMAAIDKGMEDLKAAQDAVGRDLQFTDQGLESRGRAGLKFEAVAGKWQALRKAVSANIAGNHDAAVASYIADLRGMVAHSGDTSNLILDPDLDSYYLMDITLLALPQTLDRLSVIGATLYPQLARGLGYEERMESAVMARMLKEADIDRVIADVDVSFKEDANFYGVNAEYQKGMAAALKEYSEKNMALANFLRKAGVGAPVSTAALKEFWVGAEDAARAMLVRGYGDLDALLDTRIASYRGQQMQAVAVAVAGIVISMLFYMLVVNSITTPLRSLTETMGRLAGGDLGVEVPYGDIRSEIGQIAGSVEVFKKNALDKIRMEKAQKEAEEKQKGERQGEMRRIAQAFEDRVKGIIEAVTTSASGLSETANDMAGFVSQSTRTAREASDSASLTSQNMQSVAAAAEEMAVTIQEISSQIQRTNQFIGDSVQRARGAEEHATSLKDASKKVRDVTKLIAEIAGQTNLLALNATIEAARAGGAGKGFAVVATEVKNLASQTDKSIQDIERVIAEMTDATEGVVSALSGIKTAVDKIYETSSGIASAVEEQSATVNDIVKNMQTASSGTVQVSQNISTVTKLSGEASQSSQQVLVAANDLSKRAEQLDLEVASFLSEVRG